MRNSVKILSALLVGVLATSCIKEATPQNSNPSAGQVGDAPGAFAGQVKGLTASLTGEFHFNSAAQNRYSTPWDFGYPTFYLMRDVMGQDMVAVGGSNNEWYSTWYASTTALGPQYLNCQIPWTYYYQWINNCNIVLNLAGAEPSGDHKTGAGIAYAMRAMFYMDMARMYQATYIKDMQAPTVPIVTEKTTSTEATNNPRAPQDKIWAFILSDLDKAELYLADYERADFTEPNLNVVYGLKARAYLTMEKWPEAEKYAKMAQEGFAPMSKEQYTDRMTAFNTANSSWIMGLTFNPNSPNIMANDSDSNWGSQMFLEVAGGLYASNYSGPKQIDAHLYSTIPATDWRRDCYLDPALDAMTDADRKVAVKERFSDYYDQLAITKSKIGHWGYMPLKFRAAGGVEGRSNPYKATAASVPMMRVEEMMLIEAEAAGMQEESRGIALLTAFALTRDPGYAYGSSLGTFQDKVWWQRRVELWGEGFATFDIKRLQKGITRSYAGTNHNAGFRWNTTEPPQWMILCFVGTEFNYNFGLGDNNPTPVPPTADSPAWVW